jgi:hypothetical protein
MAAWFSSLSIWNIWEQIRYRFTVMCSPDSFCKHHGNVDALKPMLWKRYIQQMSYIIKKGGHWGGVKKWMEITTPILCKSALSWRMVSSGMLHSVALVRTDVPEELSASFIRVTRIGELGTMLAATSNRLLTPLRMTLREVTLWQICKLCQQYPC